MKKWELIEIKLDDVDVNEINPKIITPKNFVALKESIETFGMAEPLVFNKKTGRIVGGNQRLKVLKAMGEETAQAMAADLTEDEEKALMMILSNQFAQGTWDIKRAIVMLDDIKDKMPDIFSNMAFAPLLRELSDDAKGEKEKDMSTIPEMEIMPYEHWDYIVLVFKNSIDWLSALEYFGIKKARFTAAMGKSKIGLGRVIDGAKFLEKIGMTK